MLSSRNNLLQNFLLLVLTTLLLLPASCKPAESEDNVTTSDPSPGQISGPSGGIGQIAIYKPNSHYLQDGHGNPLFLVGPYTFCGPLDLLEGRSNYYRLGLDGIDGPLGGRLHNPWIRVPGSGKTSNGIDGKFDLTTFDEDYFVTVRHFISEAQALGIYVHVSFFNEIFVKYKPKCCGFGRHPFGNGNHVNGELIGKVDRNGDLAGMGSNEFYDVDALWGRTKDRQRLAVADLQRKFVTKVLLETRDFSNVFYEIGNEISANHDWIAYWVQFIRERTDNPISVDDTHDRRFSPLTNRKFPVDIATYHTGDVAGNDIARSMPLKAYKYGKILGNDTDGVGRTINRDADQNRKGAWLTFASSGAIWGDYFDGWSLEQFPDEVRYFGHLLEFIRASQLKFWEMSPRHGLINKGRILAKPGAEYLAYSTTGGVFTVNLSETSGTLYYEWYNPRTGEFSPALTVTGGAKRDFTTPDNGDWALHVTQAPIPMRSAPPAKPARPTILFRDRFEEGKLDGWVPNGGGWDVCQLRYNKTYCNTTPQGDNLSLAGTDTWSDYSVQGRVSIQNEEGAVGIIGRAQSDSQYYLLQLSKDPKTGSKKWSILKQDRGEWSEIASGSYNFIAGAFYLLRLDMRGSTLTASVATDFATGYTFAVLGSGDDHGYSAGKVGVRSLGAIASFDSIVVMSQPPVRGEMPIADLH